MTTPVALSTDAKLKIRVLSFITTPQKEQEDEPERSAAEAAPTQASAAAAAASAARGVADGIARTTARTNMLAAPKAPRGVAPRGRRADPPL